MRPMVGRFQGILKPCPSARMGVQAERGFAGTRLQRAKRVKLGGSLLERAGGEALSTQWHQKITR